MFRFLSGIRLVLPLLSMLMVAPIGHASEPDSVIETVYGLHLKKIVPDFADGKFYAEFYWWMKFTNDSLVTGWSNEDIVNLEYINAHQAKVGGILSEIQEIKELSPNHFYYSGYHQGSFYFDPDYTRYPFDNQEFNIMMENVLIPVPGFRFITDTVSFLKSGQDPGFFGLSSDLLKNESVNFKIKGTRYSTNNGIYNTDFGDPEFPAASEYSRMKVTILIERSFVPYIAKLIIPLAIILFLVYLLFFIPADKIDIAAGLTVTSLLSAIAFQLAVNSDLPQIGYIIYVDKVFYTCYFLIAVSMTVSLWSYYLDRKRDASSLLMVERINRYARVMFPVVFLFSLFFFAW